MMRYKFAILLILLIQFVFSTKAQQPPRPPSDRLNDWFEHVDANKNGMLERSEFDADVDGLFKKIDKNADGVIDRNELPPPPRGANGAPPPPRRAPGEGQNNAPAHPPIAPPPFLMEDENGDGKLTRAEFDANAERFFTTADKNGDGAISREEADSMRDAFRPPPPPAPEDVLAPPPPPAPTVEFLGAEMRFGDKLIKNAPFSAEIVVENARRLFDGSTIKTQNKGAIYRDAAGRTRREQILDNVGGFSLGEAAQKLIFITDAADGTQYFLDPNRKTARRIPLGGNSPPLDEKEKGATESLGTKILEGVSVEGTRTTIEIPAGSAGNEKALQVVTERWYSPELQTVVMSRHVDPFAGEHIFRLTNIKRSEPPRELFAVPSDYRIENPPRRGEDRKQ